MCGCLLYMGGGLMLCKVLLYPIVGHSPVPVPSNIADTSASISWTVSSLKLTDSYHCTHCLHGIRYILFI